MKAKIGFTSSTSDRRKEITVIIKDGLKGVRLMDAIDKAAMKAEPSDWWSRWGLLGIITEDPTP